MHHFWAIVATYPLTYGHNKTYLPDNMTSNDEGDDSRAIGKK